MALVKFINDEHALQIGDDGNLAEADITFTVSPKWNTDARRPDTGERLGAQLIDVLLTNEGTELAGRL